MDKGDYSRLISQRAWNQADRGELESRRERTFIDDIVQKHHIEAELLAIADEVETVFDGGAGSGRFSILLAGLGKKVVHFDISQPMIDKARELAASAGVSQNIDFILGSLEDLSMFADRSFDLVMSFDAPISYTHPHHAQVVRELVRIAGKRIAISVSSRLGSLPYCVNPLQKEQFFLDDGEEEPYMRWVIEHRQELLDGYAFDAAPLYRLLQTGLYGDGSEEIASYEEGGVPWPITYHFMPEELKSLLASCGVADVELAGPGAFARTLPNEILNRIVNDEGWRSGFLDFCHRFDSQPSVCGMGKDNLFAKGRIV